MSSDGAQRSAAEIGATRWLTVHDDLLRAVAHAVSNRLGTVVGAASLLEHGILPEPRVARGLAADAQRMERLLLALRHLPRRAEADPEPMLLTDALDGAQTLLEEHPDLRDRTVVITAVGDVQPVRAEPGAVLHACVVAILSAARYTRAGRAVQVTLETRGDEVRVAALGEDGPHYGAEQLREEDVCAIAWLLTGHAGRAESHASGCAFALPTLQASRRRPA